MKRKIIKIVKSYKDIVVKDLEKVANRNGSRWRRQNEEVEFIHWSPASTIMIKPRYDGHDNLPQIQHDNLHDEQLGHLQNRLDDLNTINKIISNTMNINILMIRSIMSKRISNLAIKGRICSSAASWPSTTRSTAGGEGRFAARWRWRQSIEAEGNAAMTEKKQGLGEVERVLFIAAHNTVLEGANSSW